MASALKVRDLIQLGNLLQNMTLSLHQMQRQKKATPISPLHDILDYHVILGHVLEQTLRKMAKHGYIKITKFPQTSLDKIKYCQECRTVNATRQSHNHKTTREATRPLERIHMDLFGPIFIRGQNVYFFVLRDEFTGYVWSFQMLNKKQETTLRHFRRCHDQLTTKFPQYPIAELRSDDGSEFFSIDWIKYLKDKGISHPPLPPYSPEKNGLVEKTNRILKTKANSLILPTDTIHLQCLYDYAITHATYLHNVTPATKHSKPPVELLTGNKPNLDSLLKFGSDAMEKIPQGLTHKSSVALAVKSIIILHLGSDSNSWYVCNKGDTSFAVHQTSDVTPLGSYNYIRSMTRELSGPDSFPLQMSPSSENMKAPLPIPPPSLPYGQHSSNLGLHHDRHSTQQSVDADQPKPLPSTPMEKPIETGDQFPVLAEVDVPLTSKEINRIQNILHMGTRKTSQEVQRGVESIARSSDGLKTATASPPSTNSILKSPQLGPKTPIVHSQPNQSDIRAVQTEEERARKVDMSNNPDENTGMATTLEPSRLDTSQSSSPMLAENKQPYSPLTNELPDQPSTNAGERLDIKDDDGKEEESEDEAIERILPTRQDRKPKERAHKVINPYRRRNRSKKQPKGWSSC